jgi:MFS family permease
MASITAPRTTEKTRAPRAALVLICTGYFMVILDATVTNVALPSIGRGLHGGVTGLQWVVDAYTLAFAGGLRIGLVIAGCAFLAGAALVSGIPRARG